MSAHTTDNQNQAESAPSDAANAAPTPRGSLPNSLGTFMKTTEDKHTTECQFQHWLSISCEPSGPFVAYWLRAAFYAGADVPMPDVVDERCAACERANAEQPPGRRGEQ